MTLELRVRPEVECLIYAGDDFELTLVATDSDGEPVSVSGASAEFGLYAWNGATYTGALLIGKTTQAGGITMPGGIGELLVTLDSVETEALATGRYYVAARITTALGKKGSLQPFLTRVEQTPFT